MKLLTKAMQELELKPEEIDRYELMREMEIWMCANYDKDPRYHFPKRRLINWPKLGMPTVFIDNSGAIIPITEVREYRVQRPIRLNERDRRWWAVPREFDFIYPD